MSACNFHIYIFDLWIEYLDFPLGNILRNMFMIFAIPLYDCVGEL